jgi:uncharacterized protein YndB with AHSA1/START domain
MQIEREIVIAAPPQRVWTLLTDERYFSEWFGDARAEIDLRPGGAMAVHWTEHGTVLAEVVAVEPPRRFAYRWSQFQDEARAAPVDGTATLVEFTLDPERDGTRLRVVESGFETLDCPPEERAKKAEDNTSGWGIELERLRDYVERVTA